MTVSSLPSINSSTGNGVTTVFPYAFRVLRPGEIEVSVDGVVKTLTTNYSISGVGSAGGGNVTFVTAPPSGAKVVRRRNMPLTRTTDYQYQGALDAQVLHADHDAAVMMIQQQQEQSDRSIKVPVGELASMTLPTIANRAGRMLGFLPVTGAPHATAFATAQVQNAIDAIYNGAAGPLDALTFTQAGIGSLVRSAQDKVRETVSVTDFGAVGDGVTDNTTAFQNALDSNPGGLFVPPGVYRVTSLDINHSVMIYGVGDSSVLRWPDNFCAPVTGDTEHMFVVRVHGITFSVHDLCLDGNYDGQGIADPGGALIMCYRIPGAAGSSLTIECRNVTFLNPTDTAIRVDGNITTEGRELLQVEGCRFLDGAFGLAAGDPLTLADGGYGTDHIRVTDEFRVLVSNTAFVFQKALPAGKYAPLGIRLTFSNSAGGNLQGATALISGCYFNRLGRSAGAGNPLGAVDCYARARNVTVTGCTFHTCYYTGVRAKTNVDNLAIVGNNFSDCTNSINVTGPTFPEQRGLISIVGNNITRGDGDFAISVIGDTDGDPVNCVIVADNNIFDLPNTGGVYTGNVGSILMRYVDVATISGNTVFDGNVGIHLRDVDNLTVTGNNIRAMRDKGIYIEGGSGDFAVSNNVVRNCSSFGIYTVVGSDAEVVFSGNLVTDVLDYGIRADAYKVAFIGNSVNNVSGSARAFYASATATFVNMVGNSALGVANPYVDGGSPPTRAFGNSWEPQNDYGTAAPSAGTFAKGDRVWNTNPSAGGTLGWICTTAGTPGTWKVMGSIAA